MDKKPLKFIDAIAAIVILFAIEYVVFLVFEVFGFRFFNGDPKASVLFLLSTGILVSLLMSTTKLSYGDIFHPAKNDCLSIFLMLLLPIALILIGSYWWYYDVLTFINSFLPEDKYALETLTNVMEGGFVTIISICLIAPVVEEILFRGVFLNSFLYHYSPFKSIVLFRLNFIIKINTS